MNLIKLHVSVNGQFQKWEPKLINLDYVLMVEPYDSGSAYYSSVIMNNGERMIAKQKFHEIENMLKEG